MVYSTENTVSTEGVSTRSGDGGVCERQPAGAVGDVQPRTRYGRTCRHSISVVVDGERGTEDSDGTYEIRISGVDVAVHCRRRQIPTPIMALSLSSTVQLSSGLPPSSDCSPHPTYARSQAISSPASGSGSIRTITPRNLFLKHSKQDTGMPVHLTALVILLMIR